MSSTQPVANYQHIIIVGASRLDHGDLRNLYQSDQRGEDALIPQAIRTWRSATFSGPERVTIGNPKPVGAISQLQFSKV